MTDPLLKVSGLTKHFPVTRGLMGRVAGQVQAVDGVSFELMRGETLGLVGESGCGKTTLGRTLLQLIEPTSGSVQFDGKELTKMSPAELRAQRKEMQIIFQDPFSSLNPRMRVLDIVGEALQVHGLAKRGEVEGRVVSLLERVGVPKAWVNRYPHEFSGGQRQRIGVARAIALEPKLIVCDEAVSALDVSIQAQVVNLLIELREELGLTYLFVAHDLSVVRHIADKIAVMYLGQIVELCPAQDLFDQPLHPYTQALLSAIPVADPRVRQKRVELEGDVPSPLNPPSGCRFHTRCPAAFARCAEEEPELLTLHLGKPEHGAGHQIKCFHASETLAETPDSETFAQALQRRIDAATAKLAESRKPDVVTANSGGESAALVGTPVVQRRPVALAQRTRALSAAQKQIAGSSLFVVGAVLAFMGFWALAIPCAAVGYWLLSERLTGRHRAAIPAAILLLLGVQWIGRGVAQARQARTQLSLLNTELESYEAQTGHWPRSLGELGWRLYPIVDQGSLADPWGKPYLYRAPGTEGRNFDLGSTGPDRVRGKDDIGALPPLSPRAD